MMNMYGNGLFYWWFGVVENRADPLALGRCRVRIAGYNTNNKTVLPTDDLPWAMPLMPMTSASTSGVGDSPTGPVEGTWVFGFFLDGDECQTPIMMGTFPGNPMPIGMNKTASPSASPQEGTKNPTVDTMNKQKENEQNALDTKTQNPATTNNPPTTAIGKGSVPPEPLPVRSLDALAPKFKQQVEAFLRSFPEAKVVETFRTGLRSDWLYGMGRDYDDGRGIVTQAPGGASWHNYGLAIDVIHRELGYNAPDSWWETMGKAAEAQGMVWGGRWKSFKDLPHIQWSGMPSAPQSTHKTQYVAGTPQNVWSTAKAV